MKEGEMVYKVGKFKLLGLAVVLVALVTATGGLVISQAAGGQSRIQATVYNDAVRFAVQNEKVSILRASARGIARDGNIPWARVFNLSGKRLFDSGPVMGMQRSAISGQELADS